ncbi:MAG TPA: heme-binding beta-barrel domain-containing protein [Ilumatobacteraceae bacterium]
MTSYGPDIYTEAIGAADTLANLGPLRALAGTWTGEMGHDEHPVAQGTEIATFVEHYDAQPIDRQTNGPQIFYGLRYHTFIVKPGELDTFHNQVGFWLWEPAAELVTMTLAIPRAQVLMASGFAAADSTEFELNAVLGSETNGIISNPFLAEAFRTTSYRIRVTANPDGTWSYEEEGVMDIPGKAEPFHHIDRNTLTLVSPPTLNPLAQIALNAQAAPAAAPNPESLRIGSLRDERENLL